MTKPKYITLLILLGLLAFTKTHAQLLDRSVVSSGGGSVLQTKLIYTYNIGEPVADLLINTSSAKILTAGFIQADQELKDINNNIAQQLVVYPNPTTTGLVKLDFRDLPDGSYLVDIIDAIGHVLYTRNVVYTKSNNLNLDINISYFKGGTYFLRVKNDKNSGQVKLVKL
ncbi:T9SS type A sorting domain-containing protein [Mucilaginibacter sp. KACC 22063]|uniref:T9SS type A sorting domain-containing protein n=1 Tax=Mucilaginibacter sp. KACC 22063 TaxID=3025666 RepID=UPI002366DFC1|nr:T9SS type A sorting domain-containing protein [Mucilaginibacter sp. KACC 22063]WDF53908.1 T9SS type A sorting domain-containing protein [Mucilaginibacter sp. KACC 22063]